MRETPKYKLVRIIHGPFLSHEKKSRLNGEHAKEHFKYYAKKANSCLVAQI